MFSLDRRPDRWYTASYGREAIRLHALGKFSDLLLATFTSPAMMVYLDNLESVGPDSAANGGDWTVGRNGPRGLNENYGREVMELHTVGVNGGYTQTDVTALASILTGWTAKQPQQGGPFTFVPRRHEPGAKAWFDHCIAEDGTVSQLLIKDTAGCPASEGSATEASMRQGIAALKLLAASPQTAHAMAAITGPVFCGGYASVGAGGSLNADLLVNGRGHQGYAAGDRRFAGVQLAAVLSNQGENPD